MSSRVPSTVGAVYLDGECEDVAALRARIANAAFAARSQAAALLRAHEVNAELQDDGATTVLCHEIGELSAIISQQQQEEEALSRMLAQLQQDYKLLQQKHDDFVFNATPLAVVEALEEEVTSLTDKLAKRSAKYMKFKSNAKGLGLETLDMRVENNELMQKNERLTCEFEIAKKSLQEANAKNLSLQSTLAMSQQDALSLRAQLTKLCQRFGLALDKNFVVFEDDSMTSSPPGSTYTAALKTGSPLVTDYTSSQSQLADYSVHSSSTSLLGSPSPLSQEVLRSPLLSPVYHKRIDASCMREADHAQALKATVCPDNPRKVLITGLLAARKRLDPITDAASPAAALETSAGPTQATSAASDQDDTLTASACTGEPFKIKIRGLRATRQRNALFAPFLGAESPPSSESSAADHLSGTPPGFRDVPASTARQLSPGLAVKTLEDLATCASAMSAPHSDANQVKNGPVSSVGGKLGRRALCDVTNKLTSQASARADLTPSGLPQMAAKFAPVKSPAGQRLAAFLQQSPSFGSPTPLPRVKTGRMSPMADSTTDLAARKFALADLLASGNKSPFARSSHTGKSAPPGTPPAYDFMTPARALGCKQKALLSSSHKVLSSSHAALACGSLMAGDVQSAGRAPGSRPRAFASDSPWALNSRQRTFSPDSPASVISKLSIPEDCFSPGQLASLVQQNMSATAAKRRIPAAVLQLTPHQLPGCKDVISMADGSTGLRSSASHASSVAASNGKSKLASGSTATPAHCDRRFSSASSIAGRPAWNCNISRSSAMKASLAEATPVSRQPGVSSKAVAQASPSPARAVIGRPATDPLSVQARRPAEQDPTAARLLSTAKTGHASRAPAQSVLAAKSRVQASAKAAVQGTSGAVRAGPTASAPAAQAPSATAKSRRAPTTRSRTAVQRVTKTDMAGQVGVAPAAIASVQGSCSAAVPKQTKTGKRVMKPEVPTRIQPARQTKGRWV